MSMALVAFEPCGCAALAMPSPDRDEALRFRLDAKNRGLSVNEMDGDSFSLPDALRCRTHAALDEAR